MPLTLKLFFGFKLVEHTLAFTVSQAKAGFLSTNIDLQIPRRADGLIDLISAMQNNPPGTYFTVIRPTVFVTTKSFQSTYGPEFHRDFGGAINPNSGGYRWKRAENAVLNPEGVGVKAVAFVCNVQGIVIMAFRDSCTDTFNPLCRADRCYLARAETFGSRTGKVFGMYHDPTCKEFSSEQLDYSAQARSFVRHMRYKYANHALLLTGYSMGGHLAILAASMESVQAIAFAPVPFNHMMRKELKLSKSSIANLRCEDLIAIGDPFDLAISVHYVPKAREGATTCIIDNGYEPSECAALTSREKVAMYNDSLILTEAQEQNLMNCKKVVHKWDRYLSTLIKTNRYPNCSPVYSINRNHLNHGEDDISDEPDDSASQLS